MHHPCAFQSLSPMSPSVQSRRSFQDISSHKSVGEMSVLTSAGQSLWIQPSCSGAISSSGLLYWLQCHLKPIPLLPSLTLSFWGPGGMNLMLNGISEEQSCFLSPGAWWEQADSFLITQCFAGLLGCGSRVRWFWPSLRGVVGQGEQKSEKCIRLGKNRPRFCLQLKAMAGKPPWERSGQCWQEEGITGGMGH